MSDVNDFEREEYFSKVFTLSADKAILRAKRSASSLPLVLSEVCSREGLHPDIERSKFIKRRKLYRNAESMTRLDDACLSIFSPKIYASRYEGGIVKLGYLHNGAPAPPPPNFGVRSSLGLSKRARRKLRDGVNHMMVYTPKCSFITLSYSDAALPCHRTAKKQLSSFLKCLRRYAEKDAPHVTFRYVWVAEIQPKRLKTSGVSAIHFHICSSHYIPADILRDHWRRIAKCPMLLPNVVLVNKPAHYMSKYLAKNSTIDKGEFIQKVDPQGQTVFVKNPDFHWVGGDRYGMCQLTAKGIKPFETLAVDGDYFDFLKLQSIALNSHSNLYATDYSCALSAASSVPLHTFFNASLTHRLSGVNKAMEGRLSDIYNKG